MIADLTTLKNRYLEQASLTWRDRQTHRAPCLTCLHNDTPEAKAYVKALAKNGETACVTVDAICVSGSHTKWREIIESLNSNADVDGILVVSPPKDLQNYNSLIADNKNVEGNDFDDRVDRVSVTAQSIVETIAFLRQKETRAVKGSNQELISGLNVVILGYGKAVGKPLVYLLMRNHAGSAVALHQYTSPTFGKSLIENCDVVVCATGDQHAMRFFVHPDDLHGKTIIDAGINEVDGKIQGDVDPDVWGGDNLITPVPGGIGAITTAMILRNTAWAAKGLLI